jgi:hypothetical protein
MEFCRIDLFLPGGYIRRNSGASGSIEIALCAAESCATRAAKGDTSPHSCLSSGSREEKRGDSSAIHSSNEMGKKLS